MDSSRRYVPTALGSSVCSLVGAPDAPKSDQQKADELLAEYDRADPATQRLILAEMQGKDPDRSILVRRPDGKVEMREVSLEARARILGMGAAGFESVTFTNRRAKRAAKAAARRARHPRP